MMDELKFRVLMCLYRPMDVSKTVTGMARTLQEKKYAVSRALIRLEEDGFVDRTDNRAPKITSDGIKVASYYQERLEIALSHLIYMGLDLQNAKSDALKWALWCSDEMFDIIRENDARYRVREILKGKKMFSGSTLCRKLKDGMYAFPFIIYRKQMKGKDIISMANSAFEHPCILNVKEGKGTIELRLISISHRSEIDGCIKNAKLEQLEYYADGRFVGAEILGDVISFPASALDFNSTGEAGEQALHGGVKIKLSSTVSTQHMPKSEAFFSILI